MVKPQVLTEVAVLVRLGLTELPTLVVVEAEEAEAELQARVSMAEVMQV
jgi:hypothetical protein